MIYDCFTFFNELELLELRWHELAGVVDRFVIVEATKTHSGRLKYPHYRDDQARFNPFHGQIIYIIVDDIENRDKFSDWIPARLNYPVLTHPFTPFCPGNL